MQDSLVIDANITLGQWPTRRVPNDNLDHLICTLRTNNVAEAWAGHYDALFHDDLTAVNNRLAETCRAATAVRLIPFGAVNPAADHWEAELDRCVTTHHMPGIRLHPNYHNYKLDDPCFAHLLRAANERRVIVQLVVLMEDARMMHRLMRVPPVDLKPLEALVPQLPALRLVLLNALTTPARSDQIARLAAQGEVYTDIATLESLAALETLVNDIPPTRILFGSHSPSFYFEAALLKLRESDLPPIHKSAIRHENATRLEQL